MANSRRVGEVSPRIRGVTKANFDQCFHGIWGKGVMISNLDMNSLPRHRSVERPHFWSASESGVSSSKAILTFESSSKKM